MLIGLLCAVFASLCYGGASVLQAVSAKRTASTEGLDPRLLIRMFGQLPYLLGISLDGVGFAASVVALQLNQPLFVVQAIVAGSVGVTAAISAVMGTRLGRIEWSALAALGAGLVLLALSAGVENDIRLGNKWYWVMLAATIPVALLGAAGSRLDGSGAAVLLGTGAGLAFAITAIAARTLVIPAPWWHLLASPATWAIAAGGLLGMLLFATALQRSAVTTVTALVLGTETVVPSIIGLAFLGDTIRHGFMAVAITGLVLSLGGAGLLARFGEVELPARQPAPTGGGAVAPPGRGAVAPTGRETGRPLS